MTVTDQRSAITVVLQSTTVTSTDEGISRPLLAGYVVKKAVYVIKKEACKVGLKNSQKWMVHGISPQQRV